MHEPHERRIDAAKFPAHNRPSIMAKGNSQKPANGFLRSRERVMVAQPDAAQSAKLAGLRAHKQALMQQLFPSADTNEQNQC